MTAKNAPFDELIELLGELDDYMCDHGSMPPAPYPVLQHLVLNTFDKAERYIGDEGFVEGEMLDPYGVNLRKNRVTFRFRNPSIDEESEAVWVFADMSAQQVDENVSSSLYLALTRIVTSSGLASDMGDLVYDLQDRLSNKPALQDTVKNRLIQRRKIRSGVKSEAEQQAIEDFYDREDFGVF